MEEPGDVSRRQAGDVDEVARERLVREGIGIPGEQAAGEARVTRRGDLAHQADRIVEPAFGASTANRRQPGRGQVSDQTRQARGTGESAARPVSSETRLRSARPKGPGAVAHRRAQAPARRDLCFELRRASGSDTGREGGCDERPIARVVLGLHPPEEAAGNQSLERQRRLAQRVARGGEEGVDRARSRRGPSPVAELPIPEDGGLAPRASQQILGVAPRRGAVCPQRAPIPPRPDGCSLRQYRPRACKSVL